MRIPGWVRWLWVASALVATGAWAQSPSSIIGSFTATLPNGTITAQGAFACTGTGTCAGTYNATAYPAGCSNPTLSSDQFTLTAALGAPGPVTGRVLLRNALTQETQNANGTCTVSSRQDLVIDFAGHWDGANGIFTASLSFPGAGHLNVNGTFRTTSTGAPPPAQVSGTARATGESPQHFIELSFACDGEPTCIGTYRGVFENPASANEPACRDVVVAGMRITALALAQPGALLGTITFNDFDWPVTQNQCSAPPGTAFPLTFGYTGTWDGTRGTLAFDYQDGNSLFRFTGSFTANRAPPPPAFGLTVDSHVNNVQSSVSAHVQFRPEDVGSTQSVYVFAVAPPERVRPAPLSDPMPPLAKATGRDGRKVDAVACVLAQLDAQGQLVAVSAASMRAFVTGVVSGAGQAVTIVNGVPTADIGGATFYVGYGSSAQGMLSTGVNRNAVAIPGQRECRPQPPQKGWWWQPQPSAAERSPRDGTGYSIEAQGGLLFFAAFLYDASGRSSWYVTSGRTSIDGSLYTGDLLQASGGQALGGDYRPFSAVTNAGPITLAFDSESTGTMTWPGGSFPIGRFNIVPNGLAATPRPNEPESGWWWNPAESGRGFFIEWQDGWADLAGYMYDDEGNPVWYITVVQTPDPLRLSAAWLSFGNGMTLTGQWRPHQLVNDNVAPVSITFTSATTAVMTLPGGRTTNLQRHRF